MPPDDRAQLDKSPRRATRAPRLQVDPDGGVSLRVKISRPIWLLAGAYVAELDAKLSPEIGLKLLLKRIEGLIVAGNVPWLGEEWATALVRARSENHGAIRPGPKIDLSKVHVSRKTKSGYTGVYANGAGFRAMGRDPSSGTQKYLGQFSTAEEAAWARYCHYLEHKLPYGELEVEVDRLRARGETGTDAELTARVLTIARDTGTEHIFTGEGPGTPKLAGFEDETAFEAARAQINREP